MKMRNFLKMATIFLVALLMTYGLMGNYGRSSATLAQTSTSVPIPTPSSQFDQAKSLELLNEQIKGKENMPAEKVFKNIQKLRGVPAARLLRIMEFGYSRSLGVNCTHCHLPDNWESEEKVTKQIAREMAAMVENINSQSLKNIKNLNDRAVINCTTCHRGSVKPSL